MRASILIVFLVVAISSSTYGVDNIFGITINPDQLHTLNAARVTEEILAKLNLVKRIDELIQNLPTNNRAWLDEFKKMITAEQKIIKKLNVPLSKIKTDNLEHINDQHLRSKIPDDVFLKLQTGLQNYLNMLETFHFGQIVWEGRSFLGNPFEEFLGRISAANSDDLKNTLLKDSFEKAATEVCTAKNAIVANMKNFTMLLEHYNVQSEKVMADIHYLNVLGGIEYDRKVKDTVKRLAGKLKTLLTKTEKFKTILEIYDPIIRTQLNNIDKAHTNLNHQLKQV